MSAFTFYIVRNPLHFTNNIADTHSRAKQLNLWIWYMNQIHRIGFCDFPIIYVNENVITL